MRPVGSKASRNEHARLALDAKAGDAAGAAFKEDFIRAKDGCYDLA